MNIHKLQLSTGQVVCLLDNFLDATLLPLVYALFDSFSIDDPMWVPDPPNDPMHVRYRYDDGNHPSIIAVENFLKTPSTLSKLSEVIGKTLEFKTTKFWVDTKMLLTPHVEQPNGNVSMAQIYITRKDHPFLGTTIHQDDEKLLIQLPFRNNFGYFFEKSDTVMHGKITETPENFNRCSLVIFFN